MLHLNSSKAYSETLHWFTFNSNFDCRFSRQGIMSM